MAKKGHIYPLETREILSQPQSIANISSPTEHPPSSLSFSVFQFQPLLQLLFDVLFFPPLTSIKELLICLIVLDIQRYLPRPVTSLYSLPRQWPGHGEPRY